MHRLRINPLAKKDLTDIKDYITNELKNPAAAKETVSKILKSIGNLKESPMLGMKLSEKINVISDYRYMVSGKYIIFYKADEIYVSIFRVLYSKREYIRILFEE